MKYKNFFKITLIISILIINILLNGCATVNNLNNRKNITHQEINEGFVKEITKNNQIKDKTVKKEINLDLQPRFKNISPLDTKKITINVKNEDYENIIFYIAKEANINLIIDNEVKDFLKGEKKLITLELTNVSLREALETILNMVDLGYKIENGSIKIIATEEKIFDLEFLTYLRKSNFDIGGDVLGSQSSGMTQSQNEEEIVTPLKGNIELSGNIPIKTNDIFTQLDQHVKSLISPKGKYIIDRYTGTLYVKDKIKNIKRIEKLISWLKEKYNKQVLIEAKIIEVNLNKEHQLGINWQAIFRNDLKDTAYVTSNIGFLWQNSDSFVVHFNIEPYFNSIINAIEKQGTLKIISNPRIRVMHGQPALIGVGTSISYVREIDRETTAYEGVTTVETTVDTSAVFDGLLFEVTPYINKDKTITLHIVPIKSDVVELKNVKFEDYEITLPKINLRETSTVIKTKDNDIVIISGLIMNKNNEIETGTPKLKNLPIIGKLFKTKTKNQEKIELVILIKSKIIEL